LIASKEDNEMIIYERTSGDRNVMAKCIPHNLEEWAMVEKEFYEHHDRHPNITRFYGIIESDNGYNVVLDKPNCNLYELIQSYKEGSSSVVQTEKRAVFLAKATQEIPLWDDDDCVYLPCYLN
jgi:hypothetical protein